MRDWEQRETAERPISSLFIIKMKKQTKRKCPVCNSQRLITGPQGKVCEKCGFRNDQNADAMVVTRK